MTRELRRGTGLSDEGGGYAVGQLSCFCAGWDHSAVLHRVWRGCFAAAAPVGAVQRGGEPGRHDGGSGHPAAAGISALADLEPFPTTRFRRQSRLENLCRSFTMRRRALPTAFTVTATQNRRFGCNTHRYRFDVYVLDCRLALDSQTRLRSAQGDEGTYPPAGKFDRKVSPFPTVWKQDADGRKINIKGRIVYGKNSAAAGAAQ